MQHREALAEFLVRQHARRRGERRIAHLRIGIVGNNVTNTAEAPTPGALVRFQYFLDARPERQVRMADDSRAGANLSEDAARGHGRDAVDELRLADRLHLLWPVRAMHRASLHEHGG